MADLLVLAVVGLGTYAFRAAFLVTLRGQPPAPVARLLPHIGPAVLAAIAVPALVAPAGTVSAAETLPSLGAAALTWVVWRRRQSLPLALFAGLVCWWAVSTVAT